MGQIATLMALKVVTLLAATAQTAGVIGFFAFESLDPYKWQLLIGGTIAIAISEGLSYLLAKRMAGADQPSNTNEAQ
jgi:uncharacterized membrane protein